MDLRIWLGNNAVLPMCTWTESCNHIFYTDRFTEWCACNKGYDEIYSMLSKKKNTHTECLKPYEIVHSKLYSEVNFGFIAIEKLTEIRQEVE